jgi:predicted nucleotide-binding protein
MVRKRAQEAPPPDPELVVPRDDAERRISERIEKGRAIFDREFRVVADVETARDEYLKWSSYNGDMLKRLFTTSAFADEYSWFGAAVVSMNPTPQEQLDELQREVSEKIRRLESIRERLELVPSARGVAQATAPSARVHTNRAFIVHGHDEAARETVARFLERLGIDAVILHEQATGGRTIIEKLEHYSDVDFAVVLLTPDDVGANKNGADNLQPRSRQNVVMELGFFVGKLGRDHVCALYKGPMELPSDFVGVGYVQLDDAGGWRIQLAKELRTAGFSIDMNLVI